MTVCSMRRVKVQKTQNGQILGACIALSADDLASIDSDDEWLTVGKERVDGGLILKIGVGEP